jgi:glycosyltransferase involved in cell wall biosynthesis
VATIVGDPLVSVIIPAFNAERFLAESIESVLGQDYRPLETIVVDDASVDDTSSIALALAVRHGELRVLRHRDNHGPATARNAALAIARGDLITFLDADDRMASDRLDFQVAYLIERPSVDVVIGAQQVVLEPGVEPPEWLRLPAERQPRHAPMSMMVRRSLFSRVGGFDPAFVPGEDADWLYRASAAGASIALVDRLMIYRRLHGANLTYRRADLRDAILRSLRARIAERRAAH